MLGLIRSARASRLICLGLLVVLWGCGIREYNRLVNRRLGTIRAEAKFKGLFSPTQIANTPISIRLPAIYANSYQPDSPHKDDGPVIAPDRVQPPFLKIPGFKLCYEGMVNQGGRKLPHYCYLGVVQSQPGDADKIAGQLQAEVQEAFSKPAPAANPDEEPAQPPPPAPEATWEPIDVETPTGFNLHWRHLRVEGDQEFRVKVGDKVEVQKLPGIFDLWLRDADSHVIIVAWRAPKEIDGPSEQPAPVGDLGLIVPTDGKPDLTNMPTLSAGTVVNTSAKEGE